MSLFSANTNQTTGLFNNPGIAQTQTPNLFQNNNQGGGLFQNNPTPPTGGGGIFQNTPQQPAAGGIFTANPLGGGTGLIQNTQQQQTLTGLNLQQQQPQTLGVGIFQPAQNTQQNTTGGIFSNTQQGVQQQQHQQGNKLFQQKLSGNSDEWKKLKAHFITVQNWKKQLDDSSQTAII
ncbi:hypothetical protein IMG5_191990, partial [Ichthyophthirius multifiliis]